MIFNPDVRDEAISVIVSNMMFADLPREEIAQLMKELYGSSNHQLAEFLCSSKEAMALALQIRACKN